MRRHNIPTMYVSLIMLFAKIRWCGGAIGRASDLRFIGCWFESCIGTIAQWPWASYLHPRASVTKQYNLVPVKGRLRSEAGKVTVGLAMHWSPTLWFIHLRAQGPRKEGEHPA